MKFTKMQGCGNDYVYIDGAAEEISQADKAGLVRALSDRHFGIGGDGVIFINPSEEADFEMEMYNADGTRAQMCGNGIRCVGKFVYDKGLTDSRQITVISAGSVKQLELMVEGDLQSSADGAGMEPADRGSVKRVRVNMGSPVLEPEKIPVVSDSETVVNEPIYVEDAEYRMTCVSMGNPHAVVFAQGVKDLKLEKMGPLFEHHVRFPERVNTEFVEVIDRKNIFMRVWERGTGETLACGTGCCAAAVACVLNGLTEPAVTVKLLGGELLIEWNRDTNTVYMTGPAVTVFEGEI
ncbi:diaminopimelate epimerase [Lachnospiraceae bacterium]|jgi:diaminopimelate epimerase|nr:diaminopimelate epimerase [Lachnospiraceae bacterium]GFI64765.1 diaminopimelate epimerase [Lachnospiraceae bacterium]